MVDMASKKYFKLYCVLHSSSNENWFALSTNTVLATNFPTDFNSTLLCFPTNCSKWCYIDILFWTCVTRWKHVYIHKYLCTCLLLTCIKGKLVLLLDKTGYVSQETRPKFIDIQHFYFHFHYMLFCIQAVHFSDKLSLMCPRIWPMEYICIGLYVLKRLWLCGTSRKKLCQWNTVSKSFQKNKEEMNRHLLENLQLRQCWYKVQISLHWKSCIGHRKAWICFFEAISTIRPMAKPY